MDASLSSKIGVTCETTIKATTPQSISTVDDGPSETGTLQIESATSPIMAVDYIGLATPTSVDTLVSPVPPGDLHTMLRQTPLFMSSPPALIDQIAARVRLRHFQSGDSIITEGEQAKAMFIVIKGTVTVCSADGEIEFAELQRGNFFGEIGVIFQVPRTATVLSKGRSLIAVLQHDELQSLIVDYPDIADDIADEAMKRYDEQIRKRNSKKPQLQRESDRHLVDFFRSNVAKIPRYLQLPNTCFADVGNLFSTTAFNKGSVILARGQTAESLFVVAGGTIGVYHEDDGFQAEHLSPVAILTPGQMFGESVVINSGLPSYATYRVAGEGPSNMFILDTSALCTLLLNHEEWRIPMAKAVQRAYTLSRMSEEIYGRQLVVPLEFKTNFRTILHPTHVSPQPGMTGGISIQSIDQRQSLILRRESLGIIAGSDSLSSFLPTSIVVEQNVEGDDVTTKSDTSSDSESNSEMAVGGQTRTDDVPPAIARPRTNLLMRMEPSRRRASVAVWADPQLAAMVQQRTAGTGNTRVHAHVPASSLSTPCATSKSENSLASDESSSNLITDERLLSIIFRYLQVTDLMRARQVHSTWNTVLRSASGLFEHVDISTRNKQVDDTVVTTIMGFCGDRVQSLILRNCWRVTNVGLAAIGAHATSLRVLDVCGCWEIGDDGLMRLSLACPRLNSVDLSNCKKITNSGLQTLSSNCPDLRDIMLSYCKGISDLFLGHFAANNSKLRRINLQRCTGITDHGFELFKAIRHTKLQELILSDCSFLTDHSIGDLVTACPNLRVLNLSFCCSLSTHAIDLLTAGCRMMRVFDISFCGNAVTDETLSMMAERWTYLERLSIRGCLQVTDRGLDALAQHAGALTTLNISNCKSISDEWKTVTGTMWKLLGAQTPVIEHVSLTNGDVYASNHLRRNTI